MNFRSFILSVVLCHTMCAAADMQNIAGMGVAGSSGDGGPAIDAMLNFPFGLVRGPDQALWFCDYGSHTVRRIGRNGTISTIAGTGKEGYSGDGGPARTAALNHPHELRFDRAGNLYVADTSNQAIRRIEVGTGIITTFAGTGKRGYTGDGGPAERAALNEPISIQFSPDGYLYIADIGSHVIRRVEPKTKLISTFAGTGKSGPTPDGAPLSGTPLTGPRSIDFGQDGNLWLVTREGNQVLLFDLKQGLIRHAAGTGRKGFGGDGGPAKEATFSGPKGVAVAVDGGVYIADTENNAIRRLDVKTGRVERVAGTGATGDGPPGDPLKARLARPHGVFVDADGTLLIGDSESHRIRRVKP